ncbi:helix-turn-helix domain-containing protein [Tunturiibacter gelidiferens]|uniref:helix-turn-helix domain-containing protein n=1 Tax=Tunturiibacter gelidiferens TaxID=3069689 RepID=UPI003D9B1858
MVWSGIEWLPYNTPHSASVDLVDVDFSFPVPGMSEVTAGYQVIAGWGAKRAKAITIPRELGESTAPIKKLKTLYGASRLQAEKELNAAYVLYEKDPAGQRESFYMTLSAYVRGVRSNAIYLQLSERAEMYIDAGDILGEFLLKITRLIESGKYTHEGKMENWLGYQWGNYHLPEILTQIQSYLDRNTYVNQTDTRGGDDDEDFEHQNHSVAIVDVQEEQVEREQRKGYYFPVSRDRLFRQMNPITQDIVKMLCEGLSQLEVSTKLNISPRQLRRHVGFATEDGEAALNSVLRTLQACADDDNLLQWPEQGTIDIQACAAERFDEYLTAQEVADILKISTDTVIRRFESRAGVIDLGSSESRFKRRYRVIRIPRQTLEQFLLESKSCA